MKQKVKAKVKQKAKEKQKVKVKEKKRKQRKKRKRMKTASWKYTFNQSSRVQKIHSKQDISNSMKQNSYSYEDLILCGKGELFGPENAQLPQPPMLMFDRITEINVDGGKFSKGQIIAELDINPDLWFFDCHFKGDPVMPGCLGLDAMWQLVGFYLCWMDNPGRGRALGASEVKFFGQVTTNAKIVRYEIDIKRVVNRGAVVGFADGNMFVDDRHVYSADGLRVGLFKDTSEF